MNESLLALPFSRDARRRRLSRRAPPGPLRALLESNWPPPRRPCHETEFLALDMETTGLDPARDAIVSLGWVRIEALAVRLDSATHRIVRPGSSIPEASAVIHRITDDMAAQGIDLTEALDELFASLRGRVLLAHHARIERGFLRRACKEFYGLDLDVPVADTLRLAQRRLARQSSPPPAGALRLDALRQRYNLPRYRAHNALSDAIATSELFIAQLSEKAPDGHVLLRDVLS